MSDDMKSRSKHTTADATDDREELAAAQRPRLCRTHFGEECRCRAFRNWVIEQAQKLLLDDRAEVRHHGERLLRSVNENRTAEARTMGREDVA